MPTAKPPARYGAIGGARPGGFALPSYTTTRDTTQGYPQEWRESRPVVGVTFYNVRSNASVETIRTRKVTIRKKRNGDSNSYVVGYGKPPVKTQWSPGQSGNPSGRKKGTKNFLTIVDEVISEKVLLKENGISRKVIYTEGLVRTTSRRAANGDKNSTVLMFDLIARVQAEQERLAAKRERLNFRMIDLSMTPKEAADAYAETLTAIQGMAPADWEIE